MARNLRPVVLCGGNGTRLWPLSRFFCPKQFINFGSGVLFEKTLLRLNGLDNDNITVVCNEEHRFFVSKFLKESKKSGRIILESEGRNTAPAIAFAAFLAVEEKREDDLLLVLPSDHAIEDIEVFQSVVAQAAVAANKGKLMVFGVNPVHPEVGFGYVKMGENIGSGVYKVESFVEKPSRESAKVFIERGNYLWNSGMFLFKAGVYLEELQKFAPEVFSWTEKAWLGKEKDSEMGFIRPDKNCISKCPSIAIDYAVMEQSSSIGMVKLTTGWSDLGSWDAFYEAGKQDSCGNVTYGNVELLNAKGSYLYSEKRLVCGVGIRDLVVVETADAILVADRHCAQDVKVLAGKLHDAGYEESEGHVQVFRPWGMYELLVSSEKYKVKKITVNPMEALSLQKHNHRAEHWTVVKGTAKVTLDGEEFFVKENQSIDIPIGMVHRLSNPGESILEVIEVQSGSYLGEDDIVRIEDEYGRIKE